MIPRSNPGLGPKVVANCTGNIEEATSDCDWSGDTHKLDVRKFGIECMVHLDSHPTHRIVWRLASE